MCVFLRTSFSLFLCFYLFGMRDHGGDDDDEWATSMSELRRRRHFNVVSLSQSLGLSVCEAMKKASISVMLLLRRRQKRGKEKKCVFVSPGRMTPLWYCRVLWVWCEPISLSLSLPRLLFLIAAASFFFFFFFFFCGLFLKEQQQLEASEWVSEVSEQKHARFALLCFALLCSVLLPLSLSLSACTVHIYAVYWAGEWVSEWLPGAVDGSDPMDGWKLKRRRWERKNERKKRSASNV